MMNIPSIQISKTGPGGGLEPITPISDAESPHLTDSEWHLASSTLESPVQSNSGPPANSVPTAIDSEKSPSISKSSPTKRAASSNGGGGGAGSGSGSGSVFRENNGISDPVTSAIMRRASAENAKPKSVRQDSIDERVSGSTNGKAPDNTRMGSQLQGKGKKKGVSFLSRIMGNKKKLSEQSEDGESVDGDRRTAGMDAAVFSQPIGFTPTFPAPPKYIRVHSHYKSQRDFNQIFLAQELCPQQPTEVEDTSARPTASESTLSLDLAKNKSGAIWAMKFSKDGKYLAAAGQDTVVRIWQVLSSKEDRATHEQEEDAAGDDLNSGTQGVRLNAPVFMTEPIQQYHGHAGEVLALSWSKNNFLLSSSMDRTVRLWHVTRKECLCCFQHSDFVTSVAFHPRDDRFFLAGSVDAKLRLWSIPDKSVTFWNELPDLITAVAFTPDGRMAIAGCLNGLCLFYETEGLRYHTQLHVRSSHGRNAKGSKITGIKTVTFPPDDPNGEVKILVTSNDSRVRMYNARDKSLETKFKGYENTSSQIFATFSDDAKYIISGSEDRKVYIWNVGPAETDKKDKRPVEFFEAHSSIVTVAIMAPGKTRQVLSHSGDPIYDLCNPPPITLVDRSDSMTSSKRTTAPPSTIGDDPHEIWPPVSSSWNAKSSHPGGNIIVTADYTGRIKVFRQDCAAGKRKGDSWDTMSTLSKKIGTGLLRKGSLGQSSSPDRIMSWRQNIASTHSIDTGSIRSRTSLAEASSLRNRSVSPRKSATTMSISSNTSPKYTRGVGSLRSRTASLSQSGGRARNGSLGKNSVRSETEHLEIRHGDVESPLSRELQHRASRSSDAGRGKLGRNIASSDEEDDCGIFSSDADSDGEVVRCKKCGSTSFKARHNRKGEHKLVCAKCNNPI